MRLNPICAALGWMPAPSLKWTHGDWALIAFARANGYEWVAFGGEKA